MARAVTTTMPQPACIGRYKILSQLGAGSMGVVYLAHDPKLDREVALKTIRMPESISTAEQQLLTRLIQREAKVVARLNHPGIVRVHDAGEHRGQPYVVFERILGEPLSDFLKAEGALEIDYAIRLARQLLEAMACAHESDIIHRDLKPANLMVQQDAQVRVMDFGIACALHDPSLAQYGIGGTPRYMSPEQIQGQSLDPRSDVFSLGVTLYEMLAGRHPFSGTTRDALREEIVHQQHPSLKAARPNLSAELYELIDRALNKARRERFVDARQMLDALARCPEADAKKTADAPLNPAARKEIIDFIRKRIERKGDFPAISQYMTAVTSAARAQNSSAHTVAEAILKDFSLTNRVLRLVSSPYYRGLGQPITTISRAVVVLGMETIINVAGGLGLFEHFHNRSDLPELKQQTVRALMTALHARHVARDLPEVNSEEAFICGMLHHLGRLIVAFYFPDEFTAIQDLAAQGHLDQAQAARKVMRLSFDELGQAMAAHWNFSDTIQSAISGLDPAETQGFLTLVQRLQGVVSFAHELGEITMIDNDQQRQVALAQLSRQYEGRIDLKPKQLTQVIDASVRNAWDISHAVHVNLKPLGVADQLLSQARPRPDQGSSVDASNLEESSPSVDLSDPPDDGDHHDEAIVSSQRRVVIMKTIHEITTAMMQPYQVSDVLMMVLEGMYRGIGFHHVLLGMLNPARDCIALRYGLGPDLDAIRPIFSFSYNANGGLIAACVKHEREIYLPDLASGTLHGKLPADLMRVLQAKCLLLAPIVACGKPLGLFLIDRDSSQPDLTRENLRDVRTLANQANLAIQQSLTKRSRH